MQTNINYNLPQVQSGLGWQTYPHQGRNAGRNCNATPSRGRRTVFAGGRAGAPSPLRWFLRLIYPNIILAEPQQRTVFIGHFARDADLVSMEIVGLLSVFAFFGCPIADLRQRFVGIWVGVDVGISAVRVDFLQEVAAVPNEAGLVFEVVWKAETATPYVGIGGFMRATACCWGSTQPIATVGYGFQPEFQICCVPI